MDTYHLLTYPGSGSTEDIRATVAHILKQMLA